MLKTNTNDSMPLTVLVDDPGIIGTLGTDWPEDAQVHITDRYHKSRVAHARKLFVFATASGLKEVAPIISAASHSNRLQALLVRTDVEPSWVPVMFQQANLRVLRNMIVHSDLSLPRRLLSAWAHGEQHDTIADATVVDDELFVRSCSLVVHRISFSAYPALQQIEPADRSVFEIDEDGIYLYWPTADVHLDLEAIQTANDPSLRERLRASQMAEDSSFGAAIRVVRMRKGMSQAALAQRSGLSERHIRRVESGASLGDDALDALALAHGVTPEEYLDMLSELMSHDLVDAAPSEGSASMSVGRTAPTSLRGDISPVNAVGFRPVESSTGPGTVTPNATGIPSLTRAWDPQADKPTGARTPPSRTPSLVQA